MKKLSFTTTIHAPKKKVWNTMLNHGTYEEWTSASWPDSTFDGRWEKGSSIKFFGQDKSGTLAEITELEKYDHLSATHIAILLKGGAEDRDSDLAKGWIGIKEGYRFTERDGMTRLDIEIETNPEWAGMFEEGWPAALKKLKEICEK
jgi:uncharacterized protein YndB with AHSA1/START domain